MPNKKRPSNKNLKKKNKAATAVHKAQKSNNKTNNKSKGKIHASKRAPVKVPIKTQRHDLKVQTKGEAQIDEAKRKKSNPNILPPDVTKREIDKLLGNTKATEYLKRNVSKTAIDVICMLATPKTDEQLVEQLGMKINAIRRILNIMQGYGITNYYVSKNTKGWLSFAWYINTNKLKPFLEYVDNTESEKAVINNNCNDYFMCNNCYSNDRLLYTFDAAFESNFKCSCGKSLARMDKVEAQAIVNSIQMV